MNNTKVDYNNKPSGAENQYFDLLENIPDMVVIHNDGIIKYVNSATLMLTGYTKEELYGSHINIFLPENSFDLVLKKLEEKKKGINDDYEIEIISKIRNIISVKIRTTNVVYDNEQCTLAILNNITDYKRLLSELAENENRFKALNDAATSGIVIHHGGMILETNEEICRLTGYTNVELIGSNLLKFIHPDYLDIVKRNIESSYKTTYFVKGVRKDGNVIDFEINGRNMPYKGMNCRVAEFRDITDKIRMDETFRNTMLKYQNLVDNSPIGLHFYELNDEGELIFKDYNNAADNLLNFDHSQILEKRIEEAFPGLIYTEVPSKYKLVATTGEIWKTEQIIYEYEKISGAFEVIAFQLSPNNMVAAFLEISQRKIAEQQLIESENRYRLLIESLPVGIIIHKDNLITYTNTEFLNIIKCVDSKLVLSNNIMDYVHEQDRDKMLDLITNTYKNELNKSDREKIQIRFYCNDGTEKDVEISSLLLKIKNELSLLLMIQDVSERIKYENEIIEARDKAEESDRLKTAFLSNMSHEIRTPMNGIIGFSRILTEKNLTNEDRSDFAEAISQSCYRLLDMVNKVIDISKIESGQLEMKFNEFNFNDMMQEIYFQYKNEAQRRNISFFISSLGLSNDNAVLFHDEAKIRQILSNLIENAIKFTHHGSVDFGYKFIDNQIILFVNDTGIGISEEFKQKLFRAFSQENISISRTHEGSGLGLSITKGLVEVLKGSIALESKQGEGTKFTVTIPYHSAGTENAKLNPGEHSKNSNLLQNKLVLIVEDDTINFLYLQRLLINNFNARILSSQNGLDAVEKVKNNCDIDIILMDIKLPYLDGFEATRRIMQIRPDIPVIAVTAFATTDYKRKALDAGCRAIVTKPFEADKLFDVINKVMLEYSK